MPAQWTADLVGEMHLKGITAKKLAAEVGWNPKYLSTILNGHAEPKNAESKLKAAITRITVTKNTEQERRQHERTKGFR